ncbi:MAG: HAMP domain-containing histidine kinase [Chloroflexus sp.]|nr:HAMP domain-containing histidine kinase [Chloroflexus sp.]
MTELQPNHSDHHDETAQVQRFKELERALIEAQTAASAAARAKSAFLTNISHELRTPLTTIIGYCELLYEDLREGTLSPERAKDQLTRMRLAAEQLLHLINDMIELARLEAGDVTIIPGRWPISLLVDEVQNAITPLAQAQQNCLVVDLKVDPRKIITVDRDKVRRILLNLLQNAVKFTRQGEIKLTVAVQEYADGSAMLNLSVSDTGIGMSAAQLDRLFEPFTRFEEPLTQRFGGVGIGLAIARQLCERMGGLIAVKSQPGQGTTFFITIPLIETQTM